ncbi:hypothetical protein L596_019696 [Steinernema carpocapsae]|uniref:Uncharacterized protein n=1 Tax=Steinernema carpocapsae TaxID=34508 RepID=A0A4U5MRA9_STECR|nr:hypothetical protein L596_019696 [Steinernema carpocapsae]
MKAQSQRGRGPAPTPSLPGPDNLAYPFPISAPSSPSIYLPLLSAQVSAWGYSSFPSFNSIVVWVVLR